MGADGGYRLRGGGFHTITLGCKLNQFDSAAIEAELRRRGLHPESDPARASVIIINTCTVTGKADTEARRLIRRVRRANPVCRVLVTGCYAELDPQTIRKIGVDRVFGNQDKPEIARILDELRIGDRTGPVGSPGGAADLDGSAPVRGRRLDPSELGDRGCDGPLVLPRAVHFGERSRAFLKVQEGCDLACSYCVIPRVRGRSRSVPPDRVETALSSLLRSGYREVVLTGVNTGDYGRDLDPPTRLTDLLRRLLRSCGPNRIRLNSLEPLTVTDEIVDLMASDPRLAPHLQVPLQSGSETILRRMRRNYRRSTYLERLERLRRAVPHAGLGADVIVGFPGETDEQFEETYRFVDASPLNYLHVFSWSERPGTPAALLDDRVHGSVVRERSARLRDLASRLSLRFRERFIGRTLDAVVLGPGSSDGRLRALTGNFIEVELEDPTAASGALVAVRVRRASSKGTVARIEGKPDWAAA